MTVLGYARVSTVEQNLERQIEALKAAGCEKIYSDKYTGATTERPELSQLFKDLKEGDTIIITDMTRISRSTQDLFKLVDRIRERGAFLKSIKDTWLDITSDNPYSEFLLTVMAGVSQLERDINKMRSREGIELAKKRGVYKGRVKTYTERNPRLKHALDLYEEAISQNEPLTVKEVCAKTGITESTFYRNWKERKKTKTSECPWCWATVEAGKEADHVCD